MYCVNLFFLQFVLENILEIPESLLSPKEGFVDAWVEAQALVLRPKMALQSEDINQVLQVLQDDTACVLQRLAAGAYLSYWLDGSTLRLDYRALKMALGNTIGR